MIDPTLLTDEALDERYSTLPDDLAEAIDDPALPSIVIQICADHHLGDEEKVVVVQQLAALVFLGIIHDYDLGREINDALGFASPQLGADIAQAIGAKILAPFKTALAKNFRPLLAPSQEELGTEESAPAMPSIIQEIKPAQSISPGPAFLKMSPPTTPAAPTQGAAPIVTPTPPPASQTTPGAAAPFMLHTVSEFQPVKPAAGFNLNMNKGTASASVSAFAAATGKSTTLPTARVEIGSLAEAARKPAVVRTEVNIPRVVHYSELKTQTPAIGGALPQAAQGSGFGTAQQGSTVPAPAIKPAMPVTPAAPATPLTGVVAPIRPVVAQPEPAVPAVPKMDQIKPVFPAAVQPETPGHPIPPIPAAPMANTAPAVPAMPAVPTAPARQIDYGAAAAPQEPTPKKTGGMLTLPS